MTYNPTRALELLRIGSGRADAMFREGQEDAIRHIVDGKGRLLVVQKTGWGTAGNKMPVRNGGTRRPTPLSEPPGFFGYRPTLGNVKTAFHIVRTQLPSISGEPAAVSRESRT